MMKFLPACMLLGLQFGVKSSLEVKGVTTLTLTVAAAKLFKGVSFLSYSGVRAVTERHSKSESEYTLR